MKSVLSIFRLIAPALFFLPAAAYASFNGPAGAACSGTMSSGQSYSGVQSWTTHNGSGYWSCATVGTRGFSNPQSERSSPPRPDVETRGSKGERLLIKYPS
jgi:hypothetical protein